VGTADKVKAVVLAEVEMRREVFVFDVFSNPELFKDGAAIEDFIKVPRIVVGSETVKVTGLMRQCYATTTVITISWCSWMSAMQSRPATQPVPG